MTSRYYLLYLTQACEDARSLQPSQIPLILWAFAMLNYSPVVAVLGALDKRIERLSADISAQVAFLAPRYFSCIP